MLGACVATRVAEAASLKAMWGSAIHNGASLFPTYRDLGVKIYEDRLPWESIAMRRPRNARNPHDPAYIWPAEAAHPAGRGGAQAEPREITFGAL